MRWHGTRNGELLRRAMVAGFDALVTMDRNMEFPQNLSGIDLGIVVARAPSNRLETLLPLTHEIVAALDQLERGQVVQVGKLPQQRHRSGGKGTQ